MSVIFAAKLNLLQNCSIILDILSPFSGMIDMGIGVWGRSTARSGVAHGSVYWACGTEPCRGMQGRSGAWYNTSLAQSVGFTIGSR
jgi:hypothetical protein